MVSYLFTQDVTNSSHNVCEAVYNCDTLSARCHRRRLRFSHIREEIEITRYKRYCRQIDGCNLYKIVKMYVHEMFGAECYAEQCCLFDAHALMCVHMFTYVRPS